MKKRLVFLLLLSCLLSESIDAADGSLKIDTTIHSRQEETKELQYSEQESELVKLFHVDTTEAIQKMQEQADELEIRERNQLFLQHLSSENVIEAYQSLLFTSTSMVSNTGNHHGSLSAKSSVLSWQAVGILGVGFCVMGYSIIRVFTREKK
ncbi:MULTISPECIES: type VII secretion protein EssA [unclassified Streptococcus]|uniref:type VII secretion protein EssA n=1 Tax=unclassified Streptococcus TaxID=2608887 RepID=UPI0010726401|nr:MULTISPECIES: type VII secretion protein EssA [unclassified Streptococcus]MBF0787337.1 type VII secretion protein EssA [Streptococcus sp. 19428wC2_LYSM12]MCQ9211124.1 type VII secretion protein EssA [Streptococcus sp. B01]MCQ9214399.1 type VII secretion protein EssA [Streptococcus sp. O1]TFV05685.1 type VII secretion protein EssA [Streptococcus sp. LYSM12]